jgi:hypothetical protein
MAINYHKQLSLNNAKPKTYQQFNVQVATTVPARIPYLIATNIKLLNT